MDNPRRPLGPKGASWSAAALETVYSSHAWKKLLEDLYQSVLSDARSLHFTNVTELTEAEVAVIIQRRFEELNQAKSPLLLKFVAVLKGAVDENLTKYMEDSTSQSLTHRSNLLHLQSAVSREIMYLLDISPVEYLLSTKVFINKTLPSSLRAAVWAKGLGLTRKKIDSIMLQRLPTSLDVSISLKCYNILESRFPDYSTQSNANIMKTIIVNFFKRKEFMLTDTQECLDFIRGYAIMAIPLLITFQMHNLIDLFEDLGPRSIPALPASKVKSGTDSNAVTGPEDSSGNSSTAAAGLHPAPDAELLAAGTIANKFSWKYDEVVIKSIDIALDTFLGSTYFGGIQNIKNYSSKLSTRENKRAFRVISPLVTKTMSLLELKKPLLFQCLRDATLHASTVETTSHNSIRAESFEDFLQTHVSTGLCELVPLETVFFIWDNCVIAGTFEMLPLILVSIILGNHDELINIRQTSSAIQSLKNFCSELPSSRLRQLITEQCFNEIKELFVNVPVSSSYDLCVENGDLMINSIHRQYFSDD